MPVAWQASVADLRDAGADILSGPPLLQAASSEHLAMLAAGLGPGMGLRVIGRGEEPRRRRAALHAAVRTAAEAAGRPWVVEFVPAAIALELALPASLPGPPTERTSTTRHSALGGAFSGHTTPRGPDGSTGSTHQTSAPSRTSASAHASRSCVTGRFTMLRACTLPGR